MPGLERRVAYLEDSMDDHVTAVNDLRLGMRGLREDMDSRFMQIDNRFAQVDNRFAQVDNRFAQVDARVAALDEKMDRHFIWLVGMHVATLMAVIGTLLGSYYR